MSLKNKKIVKNIIEMFASNNNGTYSDYLTDDIRWNIVGMPVISGISEFVKTLNSLELENFNSTKIKNIISEGEFVVVESIGHANVQTDSSNAPAYCDIYRIKDCKVCELTTYIIDTASNNE